MTKEKNTSSSAEESKEHEDTEATPATSASEEKKEAPVESSSVEATTVKENQKAPEKIDEKQIEEPEEQKEGLKDFSNLKPGMTVRVHQKIQEVGKKGEAKERIQIFEGMIIAIKNKGISKTITVRKVSERIGVEKIFPLHLPTIAKIEPIKQAKVRRAKLYYLRDHKQKLKERKITQ